MRVPTLILAAVIAVLFVVPKSTARPSVIKEEKSASASKAAASSSSSSEEAYRGSSNGAVVEKASSSSSSSKSVSENSASSSTLVVSGGCGCSQDGKLTIRLQGESECDYYKRIFKVDETCEESKKAFYKAVFTQYKEESNEQYVKRIDTIFSSVYKSLDVRYISTYKEYLKSYYYAKYSKLEQESEETYFKRVLTKTKETKEQYETKFTLLKQFLTNVDWSKVKIDAKSTIGYTCISAAEVNSKSSSSKKSSKSSSESSSEYTAVGRSNVGQGECSKSCSKSLIEEVKQKYSKQQSEDEVTYFKRITTKSSKESEEIYCQRLDAILQTYPTLPLWCDSKYYDLVKNYYAWKYVKQADESDETYVKRLITKYDFLDKSEDIYAKRMHLIYKSTISNPIWFNEKYFEKYTKSFFQSYYKKSSIDTSEESYFKRITTKEASESNELYVKRLSLIAKTFPDLPCWYNEKYFDVVKNYYSLKYVKQSGESDETYISRLIAKDSVLDKSEDLYAKRMHLIYKSTISNSIWFNEKYFEKYTKSFFQSYYKKSSIDTSEESYFKRITTKEASESNELYVKRLSFIARTFPDLPCWCNEKYFDIVKNYYSLKYVKQSGESDETYISRLIAKDSVLDKTDETYAKRVFLIYRATASCSAWVDEKYYEKYTKSFYEKYYKKGEKESCKAFLSRAFTKLPGETEEISIKRIGLVKKCTSACDCWNAKVLEELACDKTFDAEYIGKIRKAYFSCGCGQAVSQTSSSSSSSKKSSSQSSEEAVQISRG